MTLTAAEAEEGVKLMRAAEHAKPMNTVVDKTTMDTIAGMIAFVDGEPLDPSRELAWKFGWYRQADYMRSRAGKAAPAPQPMPDPRPNPTPEPKQNPADSRCVVDFSKAPGLLASLAQPAKAESFDVYDPAERPSLEERKPYCKYGHMRQSPRCKGCEREAAARGRFRC